jgi:hypothetical protein
MGKQFFYLTILSGVMTIGLAAGVCAEQKPIPADAGTSMKTAVKMEAITEAKAEGDVAQLELKIPLFSPLFDKFPVAVVADEPIPLEDLKDSIIALHQQQIEGKTGGKKNYLKILDRLITTRLMLAEAAAMGIDELPAVKDHVDAYALDHLREMLKMRQVKDIKPDEKVFGKLYKEAAKEWKLRSVKFDKREDADALEKEVAAGGDFNALANRLIDSHKAEGSKEGEYVKPSKLLPQIAGSVATMKIGSVSPVMPIGPAFTIFRLEDIRYPANDAEAEKAARELALNFKRDEVLTAFNSSMSKKYAKIDEKLLKRIDLEAPKPGIAKLLKDKRALVRITGEKPITVADLAWGVAQKFFHGIDEAIKSKQANGMIHPVLDNLIYRVTYVKEARLLGIDQSEEYLKAVREYKNSLVFGKFVEMVIAPEIKVQDDEIAAFYQEHLKDYTTPVMVKLQGLIFRTKKDADLALDKLKKGTDFDWIKNNAEGQIDKQKSEDILQDFSGALLTVNSLPEAIRNAVADAKAGDFRLYTSPDNYHYLLAVNTVVPASVSPLEVERKGIFNKIFGDKINKELENWATKLREGYPVKVFVMDRGN